MKRMTFILPLTIILLAVALAEPEPEIAVTRAGSHTTTIAPAEYFTGIVRVTSRFEARQPGRVRGAVVTFEPGARTAWHKHPLGQTLIITEGVGWVQHWGGRRIEVEAGDLVWIPAGTKHWHGATPGVGMSHIAIGEMLDGKTVEWMAQVTQEQYEE